MHEERETNFIGGSKKELLGLNDEIKEQFIFALMQLNLGLTPKNIDPLNGLGKGVKEIKINGKPAYRCVFVIKNGLVNVLHVFVKTSDGTDSKHEKTVKQRFKMI